MIDPFREIDISDRDFRAVAARSARTMVQAVCCPACGSLDVLKRDARAHWTTVVWCCRSCRWRWREPMSTGSSRIRAALP